MAIKSNENACVFLFFSVIFIFFGGFFMEPFGLFQFLQNLLNAQSNLSEAPPPQNAEAPQEKPQELPQNKEKAPAVNAAAAFLENHERRARRRK